MKNAKLCILWTTLSTILFLNCILFSNMPSKQVFSAAAKTLPAQGKQPSKAQGSVERRKQSDVQIKLYNFLSVSANREDIKRHVKALNRGHYHNACVYYTSESLRHAGLKLPTTVNHTGKVYKDRRQHRSLTQHLLKMGWKIEKDMTKLLPGDICFTTNGSLGAPTHAYVFMGWVKQGSYDYAYICDNQVYDYGSTYHKRNIRIAVPGKEAFAYFMYKPVK